MHDALDEAIDRVANRLVSVEDDAFAARRIVAALPERRARGWGSISSLAFQVTAIAAIALGVIYLRSSKPVERLSTEERQPLAVREQTANVPDTIPAVERPPAAATVPAARRVVRRPVDVPRAFDLTPIEGPRQLVIPTLVATEPLQPLEPASITPISISELPLGGESSPPFSKE